MFEKIFGIFRKRKKADVSQQIPGDTGDDMFDLGDADMPDDFDADTISLETGMSDGGFSDPSGGGEEGFGFEQPAGVAGSPVGEDMDLGLDEDFGGGPATPEGAFAPETAPEMEPEVFARPKRKLPSLKGLGVLKGAGVLAIPVVIGLIIGFFLASPSSVESIKRLISSKPTLQEQLEQLTVDNARMEGQLKVYRSVGSIDEILAVKNEVNRRDELAADIEAIHSKIADRKSVEQRLDTVSNRLKQTERALVIQNGMLGNVQKALKQVEARTNYFIASTREFLAQIDVASAKSDILEERLTPEEVNEAEAEAMLSRDVQNSMKETASEALSPPL